MDQQDPSSVDLAIRSYHDEFGAPDSHGLGGAPKPGSGSEEVVIDGQARVVVLRNVNGILAVYAVKPDGNVDRLTEWPSRWFDDDDDDDDDEAA